MFTLFNKRYQENTDGMLIVYGIVNNRPVLQPHCAGFGNQDDAPFDLRCTSTNVVHG